ncbi:hypothetical protein PHMEG_00035642 [Phytophthora megakarya]|uniref:Uncharacterized protein n=1 Tax=Phytophthora megakarya TaxID=4795 RepID=A0A225UNL5_9STRA|nr:hypothetical protein PHMEG_00035642 [Phytophthora megakarya]
MDVTHPFQVLRQLWPDHACLFNTKNFDLDSHVSQRSSYPDRLLGIWRHLWGYGDRDKHPYNTVFVPCNSMVPLFLLSGSTMETVGPAIIPDPSVDPADIDPSWNIAFRGDLEEEEEEEEGQVTAEDESSLASALPGSPALSSASNETMDLDQGSDADTPLDGARGAEILAQLYPGETVEL